MGNEQSFSLRYSVLSVLLILAAAAAHADVTGAITGVVRDRAQAVVPDAGQLLP